LPTIRLKEQNPKVKLKSLEAIFLALQEADARYLVVGGVAVIAHGYVRLTEDLDLVLDLSSDSLRRALTALQSLGYRPIIPVPLLDFADAELRKDWTENRNMKVFNLISDAIPMSSLTFFPRNLLPSIPNMRRPNGRILLPMSVPVWYPYLR
jgi:hypothetical protein